MEIIIKVGSEFANTATTIGIRIPKVPQDVPVAKARKHPIKKIIAGSRLIKLPATDFTAFATNSAAPRLSVIAFRVHAKVRIRIAGTMALKPSGIHAIQSLKDITLRNIYTITIIIRAQILPMPSPTEASELENASTRFAPPKNPPV